MKWWNEFRPPVMFHKQVTVEWQDANHCISNGSSLVLTVADLALQNFHQENSKRAGNVESVLIGSLNPVHCRVSKLCGH